MKALALAISLAIGSYDPAAAERAANRAEEHRVAGRMGEAAAALEEAYRLYPDRNYLFARAVVELSTDNCELAVTLLHEFLGLHPPAADIQAAWTLMERCGVVRSTAALAPAGPEPLACEARACDPDTPCCEGFTCGDSGTCQPAAVCAEQEQQCDLDTACCGNLICLDEGVCAPIEAPPPHRTWSRDPLAGTLVGVGGALLVTGVSLTIAASVRANGATDASTTDDYRTSFATATNMQIAGISVLSAGASLLAGGVIRYIILRARTQSGRSRVVR